MKLKLSAKERYERDYERYEKGVKKFAWFPTMLENGSVIWLQRYYVTLKVIDLYENGTQPISDKDYYSSSRNIYTAKVSNLELYKKTGDDE